MSSVLRPVEVDLEAIEALPEAEREQALSDLRALRANIEANPLWSLLPHEGEKQYRTENGIPLTGNESRGQVEFLELMPRDIFLGAVVAGNRSHPDVAVGADPAVASPLQGARPGGA
jgi:hypothetical protein